MTTDSDHYSEVFYNKATLEPYFFHEGEYKKLQDVLPLKNPCMTCKMLLQWLKEEMANAPVNQIQKQIVLTTMGKVFMNSLTPRDVNLFSRMTECTIIAACRCTFCEHLLIREPSRGLQTWTLKVLMTPGQTSRMVEGSRTHYSGPAFVHKLQSENLDLLNKDYMIGDTMFETMNELRGTFLLYYICERDGFVRWPSRLNTMTSPVNFNSLVSKLISGGICFWDDQTIELICLNFGSCVCDQEEHQATESLSAEYLRWKRMFRASISPSMLVSGYDADFSIDVEKKIEQSKAYISKIPEIEALSRVLEYKFPHSTWESLMRSISHPQIATSDQQMLAVKGDIYVKLYSIQCCQNRRFSPSDHQNNVSKYQSNAHMADQMKRLQIDTIVYGTTPIFQPLNNKSLATIFEAIIGSCADTIGLHGLNELNKTMNFSGYSL